MKQQTNNHIRLIFNRTIMFQRHFHSILCTSTGISFDNNSVRQKQWNFPLSSYTISTSSRSILALKILSHIAKSVTSFPDETCSHMNSEISCTRMSMTKPPSWFKSTQILNIWKEINFVNYVYIWMNVKQKGKHAKMICETRENTNQHDEHTCVV